jgi:hypothetical protein
VLGKTTGQELPQHQLDHGAKRTVTPRKTLLVHPQELLQVLADQPEERSLLGLPGAIDRDADLHTDFRAGGRDPGS